MPALLKAQSSLPNFANVRSIIALTSLSFETSVLMKIAWPPDASISATTARPSFSRRPLTTTCALSGKLYCGRTADPGIAAGDQDDPSRKLTHDTLPPLKLLGSVPRGSGLTPMRGSNVSRAIAGRFMVPLSTTASSREASRPRLADSTMPPAIGAFRGRRRRASRLGGFAIFGADTQGAAHVAGYPASRAADRWQERNP